MIALLANWTGKKNRQRSRRILAGFDGCSPLLDVFGGTGAIALNHPYGWYNEKNVSLFNLAYDLKHNPKKVHTGAMNILANFDDYSLDNKAERVRNMAATISMESADLFCISVLSFKGVMYGKLHKKKRHYNQLKSWLRLIPEISRALNKTICTNMDYAECLDKALSAGIKQVYADPPYKNTHVSNYNVRPIDYDHLHSRLTEFEQVIYSNIAGLTVPGFVEHPIPMTKVQATNLKVIGRKITAESDYYRNCRYHPLLP